MKSDTTYQLALHIAEYALAQKAHDVCLLDLKRLSNVADYFIICHGDVDVHVKAIAEVILEGALKEGVTVWHKEGMEYARWVLLDYVDLVVHIFQKETRDFYGLERLWGDAIIKTFSDE